MDKDIFGKALLDYYHNNYTQDIITSTNISEDDILPLDYLFRDFSNMPMLEQKALQLAKGKILDVGCGSGSHSLYLQHKGYDVTAIDSSSGAIEVATKRGLNKVFCTKLLNFKGETFDTILLLMNGTGIFQELSQVNRYLKHLKSLIKSNGQILIDSSDIKYMYGIKEGTQIENENLNRLNDNTYYGELDYYLSYKHEKETPIKWLYLDFETLKAACEFSGLKCQKVINGTHYDYLAKLSV